MSGLFSPTYLHESSSLHGGHEGDEGVSAVGVADFGAALDEIEATKLVVFQGEPAPDPVLALLPRLVTADVLRRHLVGAGVVLPQLRHQATSRRRAQQFGLMIRPDMLAPALLDVNNDGLLLLNTTDDNFVPTDLDHFLDHGGLTVQAALLSSQLAPANRRLLPLAFFQQNFDLCTTTQGNKSQNDDDGLTDHDEQT